MARIDRTGVDFRRLRYFLAVCDHGGFSRAAKAVGIAQPALTRQVQLLEQELGLPLFTRNGRSAVPSEAGQSLQAEVRRHIEGLDAVVGRLRRDFAAEPLRVSLGICPTIAPLFLVPVQDALRGQPGSPALQVIEAYSGDLRSLMRAGQLDLALSYAPSDAEGLTATPLLTERLVLAGGATDLPDRVALPELARLKLILPSRIHALRRIIDTACAARGLSIVPALELDSLGAVKALIADPAAGYATILPLHSVLREAQAGAFALRLINDTAMQRTIALLVPAAAPDPHPLLLDEIARRAAALRASLQQVS